ncbi:MAG: putative NEK protein kinase [Streblomastix strix]|uniref:non-specific serine/threonine protein kinase n=1 Tax=Streblomastix strix TaxID=222440 RepID=A0A5J4V9G9_9EUKA|nr:MAG: putative NEK protein kinase [Streblomastix strix]
MEHPEVGYDSFEIIEELEGGAQGRTFHVKLIETGVPYAMKRINYLKKEDKERAEKEIAQMKKLESKFTVKLAFSFIDRTDMYLVTEYCEKGDLRKVITELQTLSEEERRVWAIFGQMISALDFLHCNGVIHRDIKPANIFVMIDGSVRLGDFGLARDLEGNYYAKEEGTKVYMAAEVFKFKRMDYSTDIFAMGIVTTELLTGHHPFEAPNEIAMIEKIKSGQHSELPEFVPKELKELITVMLSLDSKRRPTTKQIMQQSTINMYLRMNEEIKHLKEQILQQQGKNLIFCCVCREEFLSRQTVECTAGHRACINCVRDSIQSGLRSARANSSCIGDGSCRCQEHYSDAVLQQILDEEDYKRFSDYETYNALKDFKDYLVRCPFCGYAEFESEGYKISDKLTFTCQNPKCKVVSCPKCNKINHLPQQCAHIEEGIESLHKACFNDCHWCYCCGRSFNVVKDVYAHFRDPSNPCVLYEDSLIEDIKRIRVKVTKAVADWKAQNPDIAHLTIDIEQYIPKKIVRGRND